MKKLKVLLPCASAIIVVICAVIIVFARQKTTVPNVTGLSLTKATELLESSDINVEVVSENNAEFNKDVVFLQSLDANTKIKKGQTITLTVSTGKIKVPTVKYSTFEQARQALTELGFVVERTDVFSSSCDVGGVCEQSLSAGSFAEKGDTILLSVSKGRDLVDVPDITNKTAAQAAEILASAGFTLNTDIKCSNTVKEGIIVEQNIPAGTKFDRGAAITAYVSAGVSNTVGTTKSNATNHGRVTSQGDWVYFSNANYDHHLYKMRNDGSEKQLLSEDSVVGVNVLGEWVYYYAERSSGKVADAGLYKIKLDGTDKTKISSDKCYWFYVTQDYIYYKVNGSLYRMDLSGNNKTKLIESCDFVVVCEDFIYYSCYNKSSSTTYETYKINLDGNNKTLVNPNFNGFDLTEANGILFGIDGGLNMVNVNGNGYYSFSRFNYQTLYLNAYDGWLYFMEADFTSDSPKVAIYKMRPDLTQKTKLFDYDDFKNSGNTFLNVVNDWVYFNYDGDNSYLYRVKTDGSVFEKVYC